ncbi:MAG: beta-lactamase family protein [Nocardiaceae bacterium]|nr:beta-lactamase family protein [Nocardiaceae bacterium]
MFRKIVVAGCAAALVAACTSNNGSPSSESAAKSADPAKAAQITQLVDDYMNEAHLKSVLLKVSVDGKDIITRAFGESMTGVPATTDMHFRNGAVAISYVSTLLMVLVDEKKVSLDDKVSKYLPDLPNVENVTLGELAQMTSGVHDFVLGNPEFDTIANADPYKAWTTEEQLNLAIHKPLWFEPGTNFSYAHTNYVVLGLALEKATGKKMADLLKEKVLDPLGLKNTRSSDTAEIQQPVLHAFTSERRAYFNIPPDQTLYEESTYWNPSWTINHGAIQTTDITDLHTTAIAIGTGKLLSPESYQKMVTTDLRGKTKPVAGCFTCVQLNDYRTYGLGVWITGDWIFQNPLFWGYAAVDAYLPKGKVAIAVAVTYEPEAFDSQGGYKNGGDALFRKIGALLAPEDAPPVAATSETQGN